MKTVYSEKELLDLGLYRSVRRSKRYRPVNKIREGAYGGEDFRRFYNRLLGFLRKNIGHSFDEVFSEFCSMYPPTILWGVDTRRTFREECFPIVFHNWNRYKVDENGLLQLNPDNYYNKKTSSRNKYKTIGYGGSKIVWVFNKELFKYPDIVDYLYDTLGYYNTEKLRSSDYVFGKLKDLLELRTTSSWTDFIRKHIHFRDCGEWIYRLTTVNTDPIVLKKGTKEYKRYFENSRRAARVLKREEQAERDKKVSTLLHDIEAAAKLKELRKDIIDRDRHGFDSESFKGEAYHGEKRKKNKNK